jgi:hypothetical protein
MAAVATNLVALVTAVPQRFFIFASSAAWVTDGILLIKLELPEIGSGELSSYGRVSVQDWLR